MTMVAMVVTMAMMMLGIVSGVLKLPYTYHFSCFSLFPDLYT